MALADFVVCAAKVLAQRRQVGSCQHCASTPTGQKGKWLRATMNHSIRLRQYNNGAARTKSTKPEQNQSQLAHNCLAF